MVRAKNGYPKHILNALFVIMMLICLLSCHLVSGVLADDVKPGSVSKAISSFSPDHIGIMSSGKEQVEEIAPQEPTEIDIYKDALRYMYKNNYEEALPLFEQVPDFQLSRCHIQYCRNRLNGSFKSVDYFYKCSGTEEVGCGTWYDMPTYVLYIPHDVTANTRMILYFPGSNGEIRMSDGTPAFFSWCARDYIEAYSPKSIILFMRGSGIDRPGKTLDIAYNIMESVARDYGISIHGLVTAGSSNGGYCAVIATSYLLENYGVPVSSVLVYDMGMSFDIAILPSAEEYQEVAHAGTRMFFFEQKSMKYEKPQIKLMTDNGVRVQLIYCTNDEHNKITYEGFSEGTLSWATGELSNIRSDLYRFA